MGTGSRLPLPIPALTFSLSFRVDPFLDSSFLVFSNSPCPRFSLLLLWLCSASSHLSSLVAPSRSHPDLIQIQILTDPNSNSNYNYNYYNFISNSSTPKPKHKPKPKPKTQLPPAISPLLFPVLLTQSFFFSLLPLCLVPPSSSSSPSLTWAAERVLNLLPAGYGWIVSQLALWSLKAINVPQPVHQPLPELKHVVRCAGIRIGLGTEPSLEALHRLGLDLVVILSPDGLRLITVAHSSKSTIILPRVPTTTDGAMMLFTSGTTGQPKGVLMTHSAIAHQCISLGEAWQWDSDDRVLHTLPLTHIHGIINALAVPLWHGSTIEFSPSHAFSPADVWDRLLTAQELPITVFMAVPTMYSRLLRHYRTAIDEKAATTRRACGRTRLMLSGSAPLSARLKSDWLQLTGHVLLERYGMTETGMVLSNPLLGERHDGHVGFPLPGMSVRLRDQSTGEIIGLRELEQSGEVEVKGGSVFEGYWSMSEQRCIKDGTFTNDGYFRTGDIAQRSVLGGSYQLLGRSSTDIIKSGGEKVSALEVEQVVGRLAGVVEVSVVGLPDEEWGETVGCVLVLEGPEARRLGDVRHLRAELKTELAPYKLPKVVRVYESEIPRNLMGKVQKRHLARIAFPEWFRDK